MKVSTELLARLALARIPTADLNTGHIRLVILLCLRCPSYLCELPILLAGLPWEFTISKVPDQTASDQLFTFRQYEIIRETAYQTFRVLRFGPEYTDTRPFSDYPAILNLTLQEARKVWKTSPGSH